MALHSDDKSGPKIDYSPEFSHINILSLDVDWIMEPSIDLYNNKVQNDDFDQQNLIAELSPGVTFTADLNKFYQLNQLLFSHRCLVKPDDLYVTISHQQILEAIDQWNIQQPFTVWNIDHHHDCGYMPPDAPDEQLFGSLGCGNWVPWLMKNFQYFEHYRWICNYNSDKDILKCAQPFVPDLLSSSDIGILDNITFQKVFICKSPGWIPNQYRPLVDSLIYSYQNFVNKESL